MARLKPKKRTRRDELDDIAVSDELGLRLLVEGKPEGWKRGDGSIVPWKKPGSDKVYWYLYITIDGKRRGFAHGTVEEAIEHQRALRVRGDEGVHARVSVDVYLTRWLEGHKDAVRYKTYQRYREVIGRVAPRFKGLPLRSLTTRHVQRVLDNLKSEPNGRGKPLSPGTIRKVRAVLRVGFEKAVAQGLMDRNPAKDGITLPRISRSVPVLWGQEERERFIEAIKGDRLEALYLVALWEGLREGEILGLQWDDIDFKRSKLSVRHQVQWNGRAELTDLNTEGSHRTISLHPAVALVLKGHRGRWKAPNGVWKNLVFPTSAGTPLEPNNLGRSFHALLERAGLPRIRFHDLRRLCATQMALDNVPVRVTMRFMGHSSVTTTMNIYASVRRKGRRSSPGEGLEGMTA